MIRRQREVLKQTFSAALSESPSEKTAERLAASQRDLQAATREFADGLAARLGEPIAPLENAVDAMEAAVSGLESRDLDGGMKSEEVALSELIKARQNLKQILKESDSASQCRSFDKQQRQAMRPPKPPPKDAAPEALAKLRSEIEELAETERQCAQSAQSSANASPSPSAEQPDGREEQAPSSIDQFAETQRQAAQEAQRIAEQLESQASAGEVAKRRMQQAIESIQESRDAAESGRADQAAKSAEQAADTLDRLSEHLAAAGAAEFGEQIASAQRIAERLARQQSEVAEKAAQSAGESQESGDAKGLAGKQSDLADRGEELAELVAGLSAEALEESPSVQGELSDLMRSHSPREAAGLMRQAAEDLREGKPQPASQSGRQAAERLAALAEGLRGVRDAHQRPSLERLTAAERQSAEALEAMSSAQSEGERALAQSKLNTAKETTEPLARGDSSIAEALRELDAAERERPSQEGFAEADRVVVDALRQLTQTLQRRIQEAILQGALADPDEAAPPPYRMMIEEYYRALSEDLR